MADPLNRTSQNTSTERDRGYILPSFAMLRPKGGDAIYGIGENLDINPVTRTGSVSIPVAVSLERLGFSPELFLGCDSRARSGRLHGTKL